MQLHLDVIGFEGSARPTNVSAHTEQKTRWENDMHYAFFQTTFWRVNDFFNVIAVRNSSEETDANPLWRKLRRAEMYGWTSYWDVLKNRKCALQKTCASGKRKSSMQESFLEYCKYGTNEKNRKLIFLFRLNLNSWTTYSTVWNEIFKTDHEILFYAFSYICRRKIPGPLCPSDFLQSNRRIDLNQTWTVDTQNAGPGFISFPSLSN